MPERDDDITIDAMPPLQANKSDGQGSREAPLVATPDLTQVQAIKPVSARGGMVLASVALLLAVFSFVALAYVVQQQNTALQAAKDRISQLENRLSTTDESMSQSSVAMQVKLKDLKKRSDELWTQMDKLWASAWRRNQTDISDHGKQIAAQEKSLQAAMKDLKALEALSATLDKDVASFKTESALFKKLKANLQQQEKSVSLLKQNVANIEQSQQGIKKLSEDNAEWIKSINVFRKQTNQVLSRLETRVNALPATGAE